MKIDLNTSLKNNIHENSLTKTMKTYEIKIRETTELIVQVEAKSKRAAVKFAYDNLYGSLTPHMKSEPYITRSVEQIKTNPNSIPYYHQNYKED